MSATSPAAGSGGERAAEGGAAPAITSQATLIDAALDELGLGGLLAARAHARRLADDDGVRYGSTESGTQARGWVIDPLPIVIEADEWARIEAGLHQRARLLDLVLADVYGPRRLVRRGLIEPEMVLGHGGFVAQADGARMAGGHQLVVTATDLAVDEGGRWLVIADRTDVAAGAGYAMATRRITSRVMAGLHRRARLARLRGFFHTMSAALHDLAPPAVEAPKAVLLSDGASSTTAYEQGFLATLLGLPLVQGEDLTTRDGRLWIGASERLDPVDVVLRLVDSAEADPLELPTTAGLGVPGLIEATRRGLLGLANPVGSGVLDNPALMSRLDAVARETLGEDLLLPSPETWWCGADTGRSHVLAHLGELVVKPITRDPAAPAVFGWTLSRERLTQLRARIEDEPWAWVGQARVDLATVPVVTRDGFEERRLTIRTFGVAHGGRVHVMPGGMGRVAPDGASILVSHAGGAVAKDVWVLAAEGAALERIEPTPLPMRLRHNAIVLSSLAPRVAENLFWVGRYAERTDGTARLVRVADDLSEDFANRPGTPGAAAMTALVEAVSTITRVPSPKEDAKPVDLLRRVVADGSTSGTIAYAVGRLVAAAQQVRDQLSHDAWHVLSRLESVVGEEAPADAQLQPQLYNVLESSLAIAGIINESMVRDRAWGYIATGLRLERAQHTVSLLRSTLTRERPPTTEGQVVESVLEVGESIITHRRRTASGEGSEWPVLSAVSLLLLDRGNPRSVAFQLERLVETLGLVGDDVLVGRVRDYLARLDLVDVEDACTHRAGLRDELDALAHGLRGISSGLAHQHFARPAPRRATPTEWYRPAPPAAPTGTEGAG